jgi:putative membrane protein
MPHEHFGHGFYAGPHWSLLERLFMGGLFTLFWLAVLGAIVWGVVQFVRRRDAAPPVAFADEPSAMELVRRRYALGEIDVETFESMTAQLLASEERERRLRQKIYLRPTEWRRSAPLRVSSLRSRRAYWRRRCDSFPRLLLPQAT